MASSTKEVAVFTDTNLGTHIALAVSPDISAGDFKRELAKTHFCCFPKIGEITVYGLMVKRRSSFYHLPDSLPIKYAFQTLEGTWFLHVEARPLVDSDRPPSLSKFVGAEVGDHNLDVSNSTVFLTTSTEKNGILSSDKKKRMESVHGTATISGELSRTIPFSRRKRKKSNDFFGYRDDGFVEGCPSKVDAAVLNAKEGFQFFVSQDENESAVAVNTCPVMEIPQEKTSKATSTASFVRRSLPNFHEVSKIATPPSNFFASKTVQNHLQKPKKAKTDDKPSSISTDSSPMFSVKTPPKTLFFPSPTNSSLGNPRNKPVRPEVGKRLIRASKKLSTSAQKKRPSISLSKFKNGKLFTCSASSVANYLVFEISDGDD